MLIRIEANQRQGRGFQKDPAAIRERADRLKEIANMDFSRIDATVSVTYIVSNLDTERKEK